MSKTPSGMSGGAKANRVLGKPMNKPLATSPTGQSIPGSQPKQPFVKGQTPNVQGKFKPGTPVLGQQRVPVKPGSKPGQQVINAAKVVQKNRMNTTLKNMGI